MTEETKPTDSSKQDLKNVFWETLNKSGADLIRTTLTPKWLKWALIGWLCLSMSGSVYRRLEGKCETRIQANDYFLIDLLCPVKP